MYSDLDDVSPLSDACAVIGASSSHFICPEAQIYRHFCAGCDLGAPFLALVGRHSPKSACCSLQTSNLNEVCKNMLGYMLYAE